MKAPSIAPMKILPVCLVICLALLSAACSLVHLGYNHGETFAYWWLNSYIDMENEQKSQAKQHIADFFAWHRETQLKDYVQLLTLVQKQLQQLQQIQQPQQPQHNAVTKSELLPYYDGLKTRALLALDRSLPAAADLALSLHPHQLAHIEKKFAANNDTYRKDNLRGSLERRQLYRYKKVMKQAEYWFGPFSREQRMLIRRASDERPLNNEWRLEEYLRRQQSMVAMLKKIQTEKPSRDATIQILKAYADTLFDYSGSEHPQFFHAAEDATLDLAVVIINCTTSAQKAHAVKKLQQWIDSFNGLVERGG